MHKHFGNLNYLIAWLLFFSEPSNGRDQETLNHSD